MNKQIKKTGGVTPGKATIGDLEKANLA